jgi:hypothetical protein
MVADKSPACHGDARDFHGSPGPDAVAVSKRLLLGRFETWGVGFPQAVAVYQFRHAVELA